MTRRDAFDKVMAGMEAGHDAGLTPIKINCVVIAGTNEDEPVEFASFARRTGHVVRFIEYMPLDAEQSWERAKVVPSGQILDAIDAVYPLVPESDHGEPASGYRFADGAPGGIGVISSVTEPFCDTCNRLRLTAEGQFRVCLFAMDATDLRGTAARRRAGDRARGPDPGRGLAQVVGTPHQPCGLRPPGQVDVHDRGLTRRGARACRVFVK